jgi:hypothetical protein
MITTSRNGRQLYLHSPSDLIDAGAASEIDKRLLPHWLLLLKWAEEFLTRPNKDLGRSGPVCPFVRPSLDRTTFWITAIEGPSPAPKDLEETVLAYRDWFLELEPRTGEDAQFKTILIALPDILPQDWRTVIDETQARLKADFVRDELMLGQFHPHCEEPGIRSTEFRPLKSPVPMLVIRRITAGDIVFMRSHDGRYDKDYLQSYLRTFAPTIPAGFKQEIIHAMASDGEKD